MTKTTECFGGIIEGQDSVGTVTKNGEQRVFNGRIEANPRPEMQRVSDGCDTATDEEMCEALSFRSNEMDAVLPSDCGGGAGRNGAATVRERARFEARKNLWGNFEKFFRHVSITEECWLWTGSCNEGGYGRWALNGHAISAHRFSWPIAYGYLPKEFVCHHCDTPRCVKPSHLYHGNPKSNAADMVERGRFQVSRFNRGAMFEEFTCAERSEILGITPTSTTRAMEGALDRIALFFLRDPVRTLAMLARHADQPSQGMKLMMERRNGN